jgi:broad specificity phosphatase PhoE
MASVGVVGVRDLLLVRHGESNGNVAAAHAWAAGEEVIDVPARDPDVTLSDLGRSQAEAVGVALARLSADERPQVVACSPYARAIETARIATSAAGLELPMHIDERLRDRELGVLDRLTEAGVASRHPEEHARRRWQGKFYHRPAGGESWADVLLRLRSWLTDADHDLADQRVMVVSHDVVILLLRYVCERLDEQGVMGLAAETPLRNASMSRYVRDRDRGWIVTSYDTVEHLLDAGLTVTEHGGAHRGRP